MVLGIRIRDALKTYFRIVATMTSLSPDFGIKPKKSPTPPKLPPPGWSDKKSLIHVVNTSSFPELSNFEKSPPRDIGHDIIYEEDDENLSSAAVLDSRRVTYAAVVPSGTLEDSDINIFSKTKPQNAQKSKWNGKGESLSTEAAVEFMIQERKRMGEEQAALRVENERLKKEIEEQLYIAQVSPRLHYDGNINQPKEVGGVGVDLLLLQEVEKLKIENELLKQQYATTSAKNLVPTLKIAIPALQDSSRPFVPPLVIPSAPAPPPRPPPSVLSSSPLVQKGPLYSNPIEDLPDCEKINKLLWEGGSLWKIPYNGKGQAENRVVALKRAAQPGMYSRRIQLTSPLGDVILPNTAPHYICFPPTLIWYAASKPGEMKNARELVLYEGTYLVEGHSTPAFRKLAHRDGALPRRELCFSVVTSSRTLDLAAESIEIALEWKIALNEFFHGMAAKHARNNIRNGNNIAGNAHPVSTPVPPVPPMPQSMTSPGPPSLATARSQLGYTANMSEEQKRQRKETLKKELFQFTHAGDYKGLEGVLISGVPVNLMEAVTADTPLMIACRSGNASLVRLCLHFGAKNDPHPEFGQTALHAAVDACQVEAAAALLEAAAVSQADAIIANLADPKGQTTLHIAAIKGEADMVELLLQHGADVSRGDAGGLNGLHLAAAGGHKTCLAMLMDHGGDVLVDHPDTEGNTPLHHASLHGHLSCVRLLLETAADVFVKNFRGLTAYTVASSRGHHQVGLLLLEYQDINAELSPRPIQLGPSMTGTGTPTISKGSLRLEVPNMDDIDDGSPSNFSVDVRDMPPSPVRISELSAFGISTPILHRSISSEQLPRPHTASSPVLSAHKQGSGLLTTPAKKSEPTGYRIVTSSHKQQQQQQQQQQNQHQQQQAYGSPLVPMTARERGQSGLVSEVYTPLSARERPTPSLFQGLQVNYATNSGIVDSPVLAGSGAGHPGSAGRGSKESWASPLAHRSVGGEVGYAPETQHGGVQQSGDDWVTRGFGSRNSISNGIAYDSTAHKYAPAYTAPAYTAPVSAASSPLPSSVRDTYAGYEEGVYGHVSDAQSELATYYDDETGNVTVDGNGSYAHNGREGYDSTVPDGLQYEYEETYEDEYAHETQEVAEPVETFYCMDIYWEVYYTDEGHLYFLDSVSKHSQWEDPRQAGIVVQQDTAYAHFNDDGTGEAPSTAHATIAAGPPKSPSPMAASSRGKGFFKSDGSGESGGSTGLGTHRRLTSPKIKDRQISPKSDDHDHSNGYVMSSSDSDSGEEKAIDEREFVSHNRPHKGRRRVQPTNKDPHGAVSRKAQYGNGKPVSPTHARFARSGPTPSAHDQLRLNLEGSDFDSDRGHSSAGSDWVESAASKRPSWPSRGAFVSAGSTKARLASGGGGGGGGAAADISGSERGDTGSNFDRSNSTPSRATSGRQLDGDADTKELRIFSISLRNQIDDDDYAGDQSTDLTGLSASIHNSTPSIGERRLSDDDDDDDALIREIASSSTTPLKQDISGPSYEDIYHIGSADESMIETQLNPQHEARDLVPGVLAEIADVDELVEGGKEEISVTDGAGVVSSTTVVGSIADNFDDDEDDGVV